MEPSEFNPSEHLTDLRGRAYLEVKWRIVWINDYCDKYGYHLDIDTEMVRDEEQYAAFRARVTILDESGVVLKRATGWGTETATDFGDFAEKAETKALGRALAVIGFGTQFCEDYEFGAEQGRVVDSPVNINRSAVTTTSGGQQVRTTRNPSRGAVQTGPNVLTPRQDSYLEKLLTEWGQKGHDVSEHQALRPTLTRQEASAWVNKLTEERVLPDLPKAQPAATAG